MSLTEQQARAAHAMGSVAVVAGAGSGKTHMLVARYLHHLRAHDLTPLEIVAVTFTEKAAAELRARIRAAVQAAWPRDVDRLAEVEAAQIGTIHALCARVLRDHPEAAGVVADARVMDERETRVWLAGQYRTALAALPARIVEPLGFSRVETLLAALLQDPLTAARALDVGSEGWAELARRARQDALARLLESPRWRDALTVLDAHAGAESDRIERARREALTHAHALAHDPVTHAQGVLEVKLTGGSVKGWPGGGFTEVKDAIRVLREAVGDALTRGLALEMGESDAWLGTVLPALREAFHLVRGDLQERKRREGLLDYADLEVHALRALEREEVRAHYARRWKAFLLDEFQDTNPVQDEILRLLREGALSTVVGDEKQSIYGFRRADVGLFRQVRADLLAAGGEEVRLDLSFRTHRALVERGNAVFAALLGELHAPLRGAREAAGTDVDFEAFLVETDAPAAGARRAEAAFIARYVRELLGRVTVHDREGSRPARAGDVAVLTRTWGPLDGVGAALSAAGVPVAAAGVGSLLDTREALDALNLLTAVALHDDLAVVATLRSPWCALSDRALQELQDARGERSWRDVLESSEDPRTRRAARFLGTLETERRTLPPSRLLQLADRLTGYTAVLANLWGAERRLADWRGTLDLVRSLERGEEDVFVVVRLLRELVSADVPVPRPALAAGNAVTLTTMHGAKGLEWPVVIVADLAWTPPNTSPEVLFSPRFGVGLRPDVVEASAPVVYAVQNAEREVREDAEARRLLYVALTRARDRLCLVGAGRPARSLLALLEPGLARAGVPLRLVTPHEGDFVSPDSMVDPS
ncbi:UvrD-helicase domain-containing protein, partial [Deinococcus pimensis]|uniref:UvrD-helicase domain-containing protein n=1 Tax=Deinococcus pimensis TaxID=309888 RepID=UPI0004B95B0C